MPEHQRGQHRSRIATKTGGRAATLAVIPGRYALSVGRPSLPTPTGWTWSRLTDLARLETGHTPSRRHPEYWGGDIPWVGIRDAVESHGRTIIDTYQHTSPLGIENSSARLLPAGTVCLTRTASLGYVIQMGRPMATSQDFVNWVCSDQLSPDYLRYLLLAEHETFPTFASGTTHQTVYFPEVKAFWICHPSRNTQDRVVAILMAYDRLIENNARRIKILEETARRIYHAWFVEFRYPGHASPDAAFPGGVPLGWRLGKLGELVAINSATIKKIDPSERILYVDIASVSMGVVQPPRPMPLGQAPGRARRRVTDGDMLWSTVRPNLRAYALMLNPGEGCVASTGFAVLSPSAASFAYIYCLTTTDEFVEFLSQRASGSAYPAVTPPVFAEAPAVIPDESTMMAFAELVEPMLRLASRLRAQSTILASARDLLLPRLISGEIDVSGLDIAIPPAA